MPTIIDERGEKVEPSTSKPRAGGTVDSAVTLLAAANWGVRQIGRVMKIQPMQVHRILRDVSLDENEDEAESGISWFSSLADMLVTCACEGENEIDPLDARKSLLACWAFVQDQIDDGDDDALDLAAFRKEVDRHIDEIATAQRTETIGRLKDAIPELFALKERKL